MAVSYVGVTSGNSAAGTSTSFVTTLPAGWAADDVAILTGHVRGTSLTMTTPAGWTLVPGPTWPVAQSTNSRVYAWYRVLQAGDTAPTITNSGAMTGGWSMTAYRGGDTSSPIGQAGTSVVSGTSITLPTLTGVLAGSAIAVAVHAGVSTGTIPTNITPDAAYTEVADHATSRATSSANQRMEAAYRLISTGGSYGGESFTTDVSSSMIAVLVEVKAAATTVSGSASLTAGGSLSASAALLGAVAAAAAGTLTATGAVVQPATAALTGAGVLTAATSGNTTGTGTLTAGGTVTAAGLVRVPAGAALAGQGTLTAAGLVRVQGGAALTAAGTLTAASSTTGTAVRGTSQPTVTGRPSTTAATARATSTAVLSARRTSQPEVTRG